MSLIGQLNLNNVPNLKQKLDAIIAPTTTDDINSGYEVGSLWFDITNDEAYACLDNTASAAVWVEITGAGAGGGANTSLSNLISVAINTSLVSDTDNTDDLGATTKRWKDLYLSGNLTDDTNITTIASIKGHLDTTSGNPHSVTSIEVGLSNVTNDAQLKRSANDFNTFTLKGTPVSGDVLLIEDSAAAGVKKYVTIGSLPGGGGGEANTASNTGIGGVGVYVRKTGVDLEFKNIVGSTGLAVTDDAVNDEIDLSLDLASIDHNSLLNYAANEHFTEASIDHTAITNIGTNTHAQIDTHIGAANPHSGSAASGANSDITSLSGLSTSLSVTQGGTGQSTYTNGQLLIGNTTGNTLAKATLTAGSSKQTITNGTGTITLDVAEGNIVHQNISGAGTNTHTQIDTHINDSSIHYTEASITHGNIGSLSADDHTQYSLISTQAGAPSTTPSREGEVNVDTTGDIPYVSTGIVSSADWKRLVKNEELLNTSVGAGDAGKPIKLDAAGHVDATMINDGDIDHTNIGSIGTNTHAQIDTHIANTSNPHTVTKTQVGLTNVTDDAQLKRSANDFNTFTVKGTPVSADILVIEDSAASGVKKYITVGSLPTGGGGEANTASNQGVSGIGFFDNKNGVDLEFRNLTSTTDRITVALDAGNKEVDLTLNEGNIVHQNLSGSGTNTHAQIDTHIGAANPHSGSAASGANSDITSLTGLSTPLSIAQGGTNSSTALTNNFVMVSSAGAVVESATITTAELAHLNGIVSVSTGVADNDKLVTQGYVDDTAGGDTLPIVDTTAVVKGSVDATKLVRIEADGLTTSTTRVITMPDNDVDLANVHLESHTIASHSDTTATGAELETLTDGSDAGVLHNHDGVYFTESEHITTSAGAGDVGKPIVLDAGGHVDATMINDADIDHTNIGSIGTNTHAQIDTHIGAANPHSGSAASGANSDITSLTALSTPLSVGQGGTGQSTYTNGQLLIGNTTGNTLAKATLTAGSTKQTITNGTGTITLDVAEGNIVHQNISGSGTNTHAQIDTHIGAANPHSGSAPSDSPTFTTSVTIPETAGVADYDKFLVADTGVIKYRTGTEVRSDIGAAASGANSDITSLTGLTTPLSISQGGTNSTTALTNDFVMVSNAGAIVESATITTTELGLLNGKTVLLSDVIDDTTPQLGGELDENEKGILLTSDLTADTTYSGIVVPWTVSGLTFGQCVYHNTTAHTVALADADAVGTMPCVGMYVGTNKVLTHGIARQDTWAWTIGSRIYVGVDGNPTVTAPSGTGDYVQIIGIAVSADEIFVMPSLTEVKVV
jgi:hypothetical protein